MVQILLLVSQDFSGPMLDHLRDNGAGYHIATSPEEALEYLRGHAVNGIIISVPAFMRMEGKGKMELSEILPIFPTLRFRYDKQENITIFDNEHETPQKALVHFFKHVCLQAPERIIRRNQRVSRYFNVLLSPDPTFPPSHTERTATMNVSLDGNGCFCFSVSKWKTGQQGWLQFLDLNDKTPISAEVMHTNRWGRGCRLPGCGLRFTAITETQRQQLIALCTSLQHNS